MELDLKKIRQLLLANTESAALALQLLEGRPQLKAAMEEEFAPVWKLLEREGLASIADLFQRFKDGQRLTQKETLAMSAHPALSEPLTYLDLTDCDLSRFTFVPNYLPNLATLDLRSSPLPQFPKRLEDLKNLQQLYLDNTQLSSFPGAILTLPFLKELHVSNNQLTTLPEGIQQLQRLRLFNASNNQLQTLPDGLTQLTDLQTLLLHQNALQALPKNIGRMATLQTLGMSSWDNQLTMLPASFAELHRLERLILASSTPIYSLDPIFECRQLKILDLGLTEAQTLSPKIGQLTNLRHLSIRGKQSLIQQLPHEIGQLTGLTDLFLHDLHDLTDLPDSIQQLVRLERFDINGHSIPKSRQVEIKALLPHCLVRF